jgi:hypothetical protein
VTIRPARLRLRRRLLVYSAPLTAVALLIIIKLISVVAAGDSAVSSFSRGDADAVKIDAAILGVANVVEPAKAPFAAGVAAALDGRLEEADTQFSSALARSATSRSCPEPVDLELVRETQGDRAAAAHDRARAEERYVSALAVVNQAPRSCFADNRDPDPRRQVIRRDTAARLQAKRHGLTGLAPTPLIPPRPPAPPPPPPALPLSVAPDGREIPPRQLDPTSGDPLEKLRQVLQDAAAVVAPGD